MILLELLDAPSEGHNGFIFTKDSEISLVHNPYTESPKKLIVLHSALGRYLYYNLKLTSSFSSYLANIKKLNLIIM